VNMIWFGPSLTSQVTGASNQGISQIHTGSGSKRNSNSSNIRAPSKPNHGSSEKCSSRMQHLSVGTAGSTGRSNTPYRQQEMNDASAAALAGTKVVPSKAVSVGAYGRRSKSAAKADAVANRPVRSATSRALHLCERLRDEVPQTLKAHEILDRVCELIQVRCMEILHHPHNICQGASHHMRILAHRSLHVRLGTTVWQHCGTHQLYAMAESFQNIGLT
jgi:hypothetical protein